MGKAFKTTFFIKQHSTLPEIKFPITQRMREKYDITDEMLEDVAVTFSMRDAETGGYVIANVTAKLIIVKGEYFQLDESKYTLAYRFKEIQTKKHGYYEAEFKLDFLGDFCGKITLPVDGYIPINIQASATKTTVLSQSSNIITTSVSNTGSGNVILLDTASNNISNTTVDVNSTKNITAPDGVVNLVNSDATQLSVTNVLSNSTVNIVAPDGIAILKDQDGNILGEVNIPSGGQTIINLNVIVQ